jgi:hypothetical protein
LFLVVPLNDDDELKEFPILAVVKIKGS